jgi:hypothetical protein
MLKAAATPLGQWIAAWLTHQRSLGRGYDREQWILAHLQGFVESTNAADLSQAGFDRWCASFAHLSATTRRGRQLAVRKFCLLPSTHGTGLLRAGPALLRSSVPLPASRDHRAVAGGADAHGCRQLGANAQLAAIAESHALGRGHSLYRRVASRRVSPVDPRRCRASHRSSAHSDVEVPQIPAGAAIADCQRRPACLPAATPRRTIRHQFKCSVAVLGAPWSSRIHGCWFGSGHQPSVGRRRGAGHRRPSTTSTI